MKKINKGKLIAIAVLLIAALALNIACGMLNPMTKDLRIREWDCTVCGSHHNRDHNAAINLKTEAQRIALL